MFTVRAPGRSEPNIFIIRHCGLHCGMRLKSVINDDTLGAGALISICACNSGAAVALNRPRRACCFGFMGDHSISARYGLASPDLRGGRLGGSSKDALALGSDVPDRMAKVRDDVVSQGPGLEKMAHRPDREADYVADHHHSYAPGDDSRSEATYCHDIRDRVQRAVDRVLVTPQILRTEGAEGFTHRVDLLGTTQRHYAGFTAVAWRSRRNSSAAG